jgi:hypothetical protein
MIRRSPRLARLVAEIEQLDDRELRPVEVLVRGLKKIKRTCSKIKHLKA